MEILIIGSPTQQTEVQQKFGASHSYRYASDLTGAEVFIPHVHLVFDFVSTRQNDLAIYKSNLSIVVFLDVSFASLHSLSGEKIKTVIIGFCGLRTFVNREQLEVSLLNDEHMPTLTEICSKLGTRFQRVADTVGLVTPRVICMIINEAYYTLEEGTAVREDIDLAMKLGTNYPWGPFEWSEKIGTGDICRLLDAMYNESGDSRYKVCSALRNS